jgi:hypothetical protein
MRTEPARRLRGRHLTAPLEQRLGDRGTEAAAGSEYKRGARARCEVS